MNKNEVSDIIAQKEELDEKEKELEDQYQVVKTELDNCRKRKRNLTEITEAYIFRNFCCELRTVNDDKEGNEENDREIFGGIISLLHCFAMRMYSARRKRKLAIMGEDLDNEAGV